MRKFNRGKVGTKISLALLTIILLLMLFSPAVSAQSLGDVNNDGFIDIRDVALVQRHILGYQPLLTTTQLIAADVNSDGLVNVVDVSLIMQYALGYIRSFPTHSLHAPVLISPVEGTSVDGSMVSFQWGAVTGATRYQLEVVRVSDSFIFKNFESGNTTSASQSGFPNNGSEFRWRVRAGNAQAWGTWTAYRIFTSGVVLPAPVLVSPTGDKNEPGRQVTFRWQSVTGAINYELEIVNQRDGSFLTKASLGNITSSIQRGFEDDGTRYSWRVRAASSEGWGAWSNDTTFINGDLPGAPVLSRPEHNENIGRSWINFEWKPVVGADRYQLKISKGGTVYRTVTVQGRTTSLQQDFPVDGSEYTWTVRAGNANGWSNDWSAVRSFTVGSPFGFPTLLAPAANSTVPHVAAGTVKFEWAPISGASLYNIEIIDVGLNTLKANTIVSTGTSHLESGFTNIGKQYKWRVRAGDGTAANPRWGSWSAYRDFIYQTPALNLTMPTLRSPAVNATAATGKIDFKWTPVTDLVATHFHLEITYAIGGQLFTEVKDAPVDLTAPSFAVEGFPVDGTYFLWRVRAGNNTSWGPWSFYRTFINGSYWYHVSF